MYQLGLIGYPLGHSLSPTIQQAALQAMCLPGEYRLYPIEPLPQGQSALVRLIERMRRGELDGLNVTIPHKPSVVPLLDELTPTAAGIRAVNTIYRDGSRLFGDNTDAPGFLTNLERLEITRPGRALVLGAGGSARSVVYALAKRGWQVKSPHGSWLRPRLWQRMLCRWTARARAYRHQPFLRGDFYRAAG